MVILAGKVSVTEPGYFSDPKPILIHGPGNFMGELAQLTGRPALVDAVAQEEPVEALIIAPERLRALMIAEAELGERIMRALILRRVALLNQARVGRSFSAARRMATYFGLRVFCAATVIRTSCSIPRATGRQSLD